MDNISTHCNIHGLDACLQCHLQSYNSGVHTGISCQNFFHSTIILTSSRNYNLFVWPTVFQPKWNDIQKTYKFFQNPVKSYWFYLEILGREVGPISVTSTVCKLMLSRGGPPLLCKLMLSRNAPPFTLYADDIQEWYPLYYISWCFQGVDTLYSICWWYPGVEPPLLCKLMISRGGPPFILYIVDIQGCPLLCI